LDYRLREATFFREQVRMPHTRKSRTCSSVLGS
jgi:hypothetical protein